MPGRIKIVNKYLQIEELAERTAVRVRKSIGHAAAEEVCFFEHPTAYSYPGNTSLIELEK